MKYDHLDTSSFQEIFQKALRHWQYKSGNEFVYPSDVSYTLLEMMAMLSDMLNYYMEQVSPNHEQCYRNLLQEDIKPQRLSFPLFLQPQQTQYVKAGQIFQVQKGYETYCLEAQQATVVSSLQVKAIYYRDSDDSQRIDHLLRQRDGVFTLPLSKQQGELIILLNHEIKKGEVQTLYIRCEDEFRNPKGTYFPFGVLEMSCYTAKGWKKGSILEDQTWSFLYSGCVRIQVDDDMQQVEYEYEPAYALRFTLDSAQYDRLPTLRELQVSAIEVKAQKHLSRAYDRWCTSKPDTHIRIDEEITDMELLVLKEDKHECGLFHEIPYTVQKYASYWDIIVKVRTYPAHLRVICTYLQEDNVMYQGVTSQCIPLNNCSIDYVMVKTSAGYRHVPCYEMLEKAPYGYGCWKKSDCLQFGNGRDFKIMESGRLWYGNLIQYGTVKDKETVIQQSEIQFDIPALEYSSQLSETICTIEDLKTAVKQMPTFAIDEVQVYAGDTDWHIYIHNACECYPIGYLQQIEAYLSPYMMIGVTIKTDILKRIPIAVTVLSAVADTETLHKKLQDFIQSDLRKFTKTNLSHFLNIAIDQIETRIEDVITDERILEENECFYLQAIAFA